MEPQAYHTCNPNRNLVVVTMVAIISIILSPAHISLSIAKPTKVSKADQEDTQRYNFTLVAQNKSPHMAVVYGTLSVEIWYNETAWVCHTRF